MSAAAAQPGGSRATTLPGRRQGALAHRPGSMQREEQELSTAPESPTDLAIRRLKENRTAQVAAVIFVILATLCASAGAFESGWAGRTAIEQNLSGTATIDGEEVEVVSLKGQPNVGPGMRKEYTFGADQLGRDVFMRMLRGGGISLRVGIGAASITVLLGTVIGLIGGFYRGRVDKFVGYVVDVMLAFPSTIFAIALSASIAASGKIGPIPASSIMVPLLIIGILAAPGFSRVIRSKALELQAQEYVEAARALGADDRRIMFRHMLPHLIPTIVTWFGIVISTAIVAEAGLSFLGVGVQPPTPSWGNLIADGKFHYATAWWISAGGGLMVVITVLTLNIIGEGLEEALDPKSGGR